MRQLRPVKIAGLSTYVPPRVLTNADLEKLVNTSDEWILQRTGIRERHIAEPGVATSDLAKVAAEGAMKEAGITAADVGFIVVGTTTPDTIFPSTACMLQTKIGAAHAWGFDLGAACSGFTYALTTAAQMVATGAHDYALAVGADVMSSIIDYTDRTTCVLFGDGAGAVVVAPAVDGEASIIDFAHAIDGSGGAALCMTSEYKVANRPKGRVLVDYNQNAWGRTLASIYSVRPHPLACVSTPVTWKEVDKGVRIEDFRLDNVRARFKKTGDLFKPLLLKSKRVDLGKFLKPSR